MKITALGSGGRIFLLFCSASLLVFLAWLRLGRQGIDYARVYRIGYGNDVPLHFKGEDGLPTGLAVELVKEAARRKGIELQWVEFRTKSPTPVELTVLQTIRPERRNTTYFTEPYLESASCFVVLAGSPVQEPNDLRSARITFLNFRVHRDNLGRLLPDSQLMPEESSREALRKMAAGLSDAAYLDQYALLTAMLSGGVPVPIRIVGVDVPKTQLAIASLPAVAAVADKIREGMRSMGDDGSVARLVERWAFFPHLTTDVIRSLATSQRSNRWLAAGLCGLAVVLLATTWLALRLRSQTIRLKQAEEARQYLSEIVEKSRNEIYIFDSRSLKLNHANLGASKNLRYTTEALKDLTPLDLMPEFTDSSFRALIRPLLTKERELLVFQTVLRRADGSRYPVEVHLQWVTTGRQHVFLAVILEITARKLAEAEKEKLEAQNRQLQKSESLGRMAGAIAHHFNNQLQAVMLGLEMATNDLLRNAEPLEALSAAMQSARKAAEVSTLMLTYLGQSRGKHEPLDLADVCLGSLPLLRAALPPNLALETDLPSPGPGISANANQLQQVLTNLLTNAWEASGDGRGVIRLSVKTVTAADIPATRRFPLDHQPQEGAYACLEVADAGCGIAAKDFDKLFDPFFSTKFTGRGLGLPVVLGIARSHDGVVTVESEPGRGSVFRVFFPVSAEAVVPQKPVQLAAAAPITAEDGPPACQAQAVTVLVVEDEPIVRKVVTVALKRSGFSVLAAEDGVAAVELFRQHRAEIGCVVCDLTMPRMNGWETLTALRQLVPGLPVILASGYSEAQVMAGDHPERPQAFLQKPYEVKALINVIRQVLPNKKS